MTFPNSEDDHDAEPELDAGNLAALGLYLEAPDEADDVPMLRTEALCYLWPCNVATFKIWQRVQTQWTLDAGGNLVGLHYQNVIALVDRLRLVKPKDFAECFAGLQAMERAAIEVSQEQARERQRNS